MRPWLRPGSYLLEQKTCVCAVGAPRTIHRATLALRKQGHQRGYLPSPRWSKSSNFLHASARPGARTPQSRKDRPAQQRSYSARAKARQHVVSTNKPKPSSKPPPKVQSEFIYTKPRILESTDFPPANLLGERDRERLIEHPQLIESTLQEFARVSEHVKPISGGLRNSLTVTWKDSTEEPLRASGDAVRNDVARRNAWLHLIAKLHKAGQLNKILGETVVSVPSELAREEQNALVEVYEYCIKHGHLPIIERKPRRSRNRAGWQTSIEFPHQSISVKAASKQAPNADLLAALKFKVAAEHYQTQQGTTALTVKSKHDINIENAEQFLLFYACRRNFKRKTPIVESKSIDGQCFESSVEMDGEPVGKPVITVSKKMGEKLAFLVAAHEIVSREPELKPKFSAALANGKGKFVLPVVPLTLPIGDKVVLRMQQTVLEARKNGLADEYEPLMADVASEEEYTFIRSKPPEDTLQARNEKMQQMRKHFQTSEEHEPMRNLRRDLPMSHHAEGVLDIIEQNLYSIIIGETGSGKTTQVPQILLDHYIDAGNGTKCNVICTQPRRIAATSVAQRVAAERGEPLGASVGFSIRGVNQTCWKLGSINYCTTGTLLVQLQTNPDAVCDRVTHIILDEVHERDRFLDYTMIILKEVISLRLAAGKSVPRVTLMSATLDPDLFSPYFPNQLADGSIGATPVLRVPGRTFPVKEVYLDTIYEQLRVRYGHKFVEFISAENSTVEYLRAERECARENDSGQDAQSEPTEQASTSQQVIDWKRLASSAAPHQKTGEELEKEDSLVPIHLVTAMIAHVATSTTDGAILVFLPGLDEILAVDKLLQSQGLFQFDHGKFVTFMLHSSIGGDSQNSVFNEAPPGTRKIILSTNIAETSITIPDVQHVIDTGKHREMHYNQLQRLTSLRTSWISKSNAKQRAGRAGRVQNGNYYGLYSKARGRSMRAVGLPELLRTDLQETCLHIVAQKWRMEPREFLSKAIEPPDPVAIDASMHNLVAIEALTSDEEITPLGRLLFTLPIHPELGKMLVYGIILRCLYPMIVLGAAAQSRPIFTTPMPGERETAARIKEYFASGTESDHIAILNAFKKLRQIQKSDGAFAAQRFARANYLHWGGFKMIESTAALIEKALASAGIIPVNANGQADDELALLNENANKPYVIKALTVAGLYPRVTLKVNARGYHWRTEYEAEVALHPNSVNDTRPSNTEGSLLATYDQLSRSVDGRSLFARTNTLVSPLAVALFSGKLSTPAQNSDDLANFSIWDRSTEKEQGRVVVVDDWLPFYVLSQHRNAPHILIELRKALQRMLVSAYADLNKRKSLTDDPVRAGFAKHIVEILRLDPHTFKLDDRQTEGRILDSITTGGTSPNEGESEMDPVESFGGSLVSSRPPSTRPFQRSPYRPRHEKGPSSHDNREVRSTRSFQRSSYRPWNEKRPSRQDNSEAPSNVHHMSRARRLHRPQRGVSVPQRGVSGIELKSTG